jgi:hypothetical protein
MDAANLLREYHRQMSDARYGYDIESFDVTFWNDHGPAPTASIGILNAHLRRVQGVGSPLECDAALAQAIKEITNG